MKEEPKWYRGTEQCVEANLHQLELGVIDKQTALKYIMAHVMTLLETEMRNNPLNEKE